MKAPTLLRAWMKANGFTQAELAKRLDVSTPAVSVWMNGIRQPTMKHAGMVERITGGAVPLSAWLKDENGVLPDSDSGPVALADTGDTQPAIKPTGTES